MKRMQATTPATKYPIAIQSPDSTSHRTMMTVFTPASSLGETGVSGPRTEGAEGEGARAGGNGLERDADVFERRGVDRAGDASEGGEVEVVHRGRGRAEHGAHGLFVEAGEREPDRELP